MERVQRILCNPGNPHIGKKVRISGMLIVARFNSQGIQESPAIITFVRPGKRVVYPCVGQLARPQR